MTRSNKNSNNFPPPPPPVFSPPEDRYHQLSEESDGVPSPPAFAGIFSPEELSMDNYASQSFHHPPRMDGLALDWEYQQPLYYDGSGSKSSTSPASSLESPSPPPLWSQPEQPLFSNGFSSMAGNVPGFVVPATPSVEFPDWQSPLFASSIEISLPFAPDIKKETDDNSRSKLKIIQCFANIYSITNKTFIRRSTLHASIDFAWNSTARADIEA